LKGKRPGWRVPSPKGWPGGANGWPIWRGCCRAPRPYGRILARLSDRLEALDRMRVTLGYTETLKRGFAVVRKGEAVVMDAGKAQGAALEIEFRDGRVEVQANGRAQKAQKKAKPTEQGSLF